MKCFLEIILVVAFCITSSHQQKDCWWSGCQPTTWAQRGCFPANEWHQTNIRPCSSGSPGNEYYCCPTGGPPPGPGPAPGPGPSPGTALVSFPEFLKAVVSNGYPSPSKVVYDAFIEGLPKGSISTKEEAAMALAQFLHESAGLTAKRELRCISNGCPGDYKTPGCDVAGQNYYGRGYIQLTWCENYRAASQDLLGNNALVTNPDSVASNETLSWSTAFWFWKVNVHGKPGVSSGEFGATTKAINGGLECGQGPNMAIAHIRFSIYGKVRAAFSLSGPGNERGTTPVETGICSFYGAPGELPAGALTASGAVFNPNAMAAAHKTIAFGRSVRVKNDKTGQTVDVVIDDRGPFVPGRILDLNYAPFGRIGNYKDGLISCSYVFI